MNEVIETMRVRKYNVNLIIEKRSSSQIYHRPLTINVVKSIFYPHHTLNIEMMIDIYSNEMLYTCK